jgi:glycosyltransferase involved in cell wall biosynthesis
MLMEAVVSVLGQSFQEFELIVLDNCSTDDTESVVYDFLKSDNRIKYIKNTNNIGVVRNFEKAVSIASGKYILILGDDDALTKNAVSDLYQAIESFPTASFAYGLRIDINQRSGRPEEVKSYNKALLQDKTIISRQLYFRGNIVGEPSAVMMKTCLAKGGFSYGFTQLLDVGMWIHLLKIGPCVRVPKIVARIRSHSQRLSYANNRNGTTIRDFQNLFNIYGRSKKIEGRIIDRMLWDLRMLWRFYRVLYNNKCLQIETYGTVSEFYYQWFFDKLTVILRCFTGLFCYLNKR